MTKFDLENGIDELYTYIIHTDDGFAPNYTKFCTLACCKGGSTGLRARLGESFLNRKPDDKRTFWVLGVASKGLEDYTKGERKELDIVYIMQVKEVIDYNEYWSNKKYNFKKYQLDPNEKNIGDNIYHTENGKDYIQEDKSRHDEDNKKSDVAGKYVLISDENNEELCHYLHFPVRGLNNDAAIDKYRRIGLEIYGDPEKGRNGRRGYRHFSRTAKHNSDGDKIIDHLEEILINYDCNIKYEENSDEKSKARSWGCCGRKRKKNSPNETKKRNSC